MEREIVSQYTTANGRSVVTRYSDGGLSYESTAKPTAEEEAAARVWLDRVWVQPMMRFLMRAPGAA